MVSTNHVAAVLLAIAAGTSGADRAGSTSPARTSDVGVVWSQSYDVGMRVAAMEKCPMMVLFTASWCTWCHKLESEVLNQPQVMSALRGFACVRIDVDKQRDIALAYGVMSLPKIIVVNTQGEIIGDWLGYHSLEDFLRLLADIEPYLDATTGMRRAPTITRKDDRPPNDTAQAEPAADPMQLLELLGHRMPDIRRKAIDVLVKGGTAVVPLLTDVLRHDYLGVRIAAWRAIRLLSNTDLEFDPWAPHAERDETVRQIQEKLSDAPSPDETAKP